MMNGELDNQVIQILARISGKNADTIHDSTTLTGDLGMDSALALLLLVELEDTFDVTLSDRAAAKMRTVGDVLNHLRSVVKPA